MVEKINEDDVTKEDKQNVGCLCPKEKRKRRKAKSIETKTTETVEKKLGRKMKGANKKGNHTKNDVDNVIKKIKRVFFDKLPEYMLSLIHI